MKARSLLVLVSLFAVGVAGAATAVDRLPLPERAIPALEPILRQAAQQSPRMLARAIDLEIAENGRIQNRSGVLPSVGGSYRFYETRDDRADLAESTRVQKSYYDFSITQPLFYWGERMNVKKIGEIQKLISEGNYREAYRGLAQDLRGKYLTLIMQKQSLKRAEEALAYAMQQVKLGEERLAKKVISDVEMNPIRLAAEQGQINLERTAFDFEQGRKTFARLAGLGELTAEQIPDEVPSAGYDAPAFDQLLAEFLSAKEQPTAEAVTARRQIAVAELFYKNEKTRLRPKFNLTAGANQDEQSYTINAAQKYRINSLYAGITVNWTVFDGFFSNASTRSALARLRQTRLDSEELYNRLAQQAQQQVKHINFSARAMAIADRALISAEGTLRTRSTDFQRGVASESDVTLARIALLDARVNAFGARLDYLYRVGDFLGTIAADPVLSSLPVAR